MIRHIVGYEHDEEAFMAELDFAQGRLRQLRDLLETDDDHDLVNVYQLDDEALALVESWLELTLDRSLEYFLETTSDWR